MTPCEQLLINIVMQPLTGIATACVTKYVIDKRVEKQTKFKNDVLQIYLTFLQYETKSIGEIGAQNLESFLQRTNTTLSGNKALYVPFEKVYSDMKHALRYKQESSSILNCDGENYSNFKIALENFLKL